MNDPTSGAESVLHGAIRVGSKSYEYTSSFSGGLRFRCLADCGLCCRTYRVPLTGMDLDRLKRVVDPENCASIAFAPEAEAAEIRAFMENGKVEGCCYLDENARCSVYDNRPLYCRTYPLIRDTYEQLEMSVDYTCPGVGEGDPVTGEQVEEAFRIEARDRPETMKVFEVSANYRVISGSLKAMGVYTEAELIRSVCVELVRPAVSFRRSTEFSAYFKGAAVALAETLAGAGNITDPQASGRFLESVRGGLEDKPAETPRHTAAESAHMDPQIPQDGELCEAAVESLAEYLGDWIRRQALLRFVHTSALACPARLNVLNPFFAFLADAACSVLRDADELRSLWGEQRITARVMREAIRRNEGPLRSRCASVVSTE